MKPTRSLLLATAFLTALSACGSSGSNRSSGAATQSDGPTPAEVDTYLEALLPEQCDVEKIETANFIDPVSKEGRVSVKFDLVLNAPLYRRATEEEIDLGFAKAGLPDRARSPWEEFHRPYFVQAVTAPGFRQPMTFDIQAAKSVDGWKLNSLAGAFIMEKLRAEGPPEIEKAEFLAKIGGNPVPLDSDQAVQFFEQQAQLQAKDPA